MNLIKKAILNKMNALLLLAGMTYLSLIPEVLVNTSATHMDKVQHALSYGMVFLMATGGVIDGRKSIYLAAGLIFYSGFIEVMQGYFPPREPSWADLLANAAGVGIAAALIWATRKVALVNKNA